MRNAGQLVIVLLFSFALLCLGCFFLWFHSLDTAACKQFVDSLSSGGAAENFPEDRIERIQRNSWALGIIYFIWGGATLAFSGNLSRQLSPLCGETSKSFSRCWRKTRLMFRARWTAHRWTLLLLVVAGIALRWAFLRQPCRTDEEANILLGAFSAWPVAIGDYYAPNNHLLNTVFMKILLGVLGDSLVTFRLPAFLFGCLIPPLSYLVGRKLYSRNAGLLAAALAASSPYLVLYSTNARGYSFVVVTSLLLVLLTLKLGRRVTTARLFSFAFIGSLGLFSVPTMLYPYLSINLWLAIDWFRSVQTATYPARIRDLALIQLLTGILVFLWHTPAFFISGIEAFTNNDYVQPLESIGMLTSTVWERAEALSSHATIGFPVPFRWGIVAGILFCALLVRPSSFLKRSFGVAVFLGLAITITILFRVGFARVFLPYLVFGYILSAAGWAELVRRTTGRASLSETGFPAMALVLGLALSWQTWNTRSPEANIDGSCIDGPEIAVFLKSKISDNDSLVYHDWDAGVHFHLHEQNIQLVNPLEADRVWILVNEPITTVDEVLAYRGLQLVSPDQLEEVARFRRSRLFLTGRVRRIDSD